jgi:integrase
MDDAMKGTVVTQWLDYQALRGFSPATIRRRRQTLSSWARFLAPADPLSGTLDDVEQWLRRWPVARTRHHYRSDLSLFYAWAVKRGLAAANPLDMLDPIRVPKPAPKPVPPALVLLAISSAPTGWLQRALALAAFAGLRRSEIANLTTDHLRLHQIPPVLHVEAGKGGKDRVVPISPPLRLLLDGLPRGPVVDRAASTIGIAAAEHMRGIGIDATLHCLRHSFGTELARAAHGNVVLVAAAMGHSRIETTMGYVGWSGGDAAGLVDGLYDDAA